MADKDSNEAQGQRHSGWGEGSLANEAKEALGQAKEYVSETVESAVEAGKEGYESVRNQARQTYDQARERGQKAINSVQHQVEEHPMTSVLTTLAAGFILGFVVSQLFSSSRHY